MDHLPAFRMYITGVPGTGKTSVAEKLCKQLSLEYIEINTIVLDKGLFLGYDIGRDTVIIDEELLIPHMDSLMTTQRRFCIVGGVIPFKTLFNLVIVLRCAIHVLRTRLQARDYPIEKIEANVQAEIMNVMFFDALELISAEKTIEVSNDDHSINETCSQITSVIREHFLRDLI